MGADLGGRAGDKGTSRERRVRKLADALGRRERYKKPCGAQDRGTEAQVRGVGHGKRNRKQRGGRIKGSGLRIKGAWLRVTRVGLRIRRVRSKIGGAGRSAESPGATAPGGRDEGPCPKTRPGRGVGARGGALPKGPAPARPARSRPSGPTRARPHRPHGLLQQCPEPAQHDGGPVRLAARLRVAAPRWRRRRPNGREAGPGPETPPLPEGSGRSKPRAGQVLKESLWGASWGADDRQ